MPTFEYQAQRTDGTIENGVAVGTSLDGVAADLASKGMRVTRIGLAAAAGDPIAGFQAPSARPVERPAQAERPAATGNPYDVGVPVENPRTEEKILEQRSYVATSVVGPLVGNVSLAALSFFFHQASTMLHAGVPVVQSFDTLAKQSQSPKLRGVISEIARHVEEGRPISFGMQRYPEVFSPIMLSMVRAGEEAGFIDTALQIVAEYIDEDIRIRNLYRRATFYPKLEVGASIVIIIGANMILQSLKPGAEGLHSPLTTLATWFWLVPLIVGIFLFVRIGLANPRIKYNWDVFVSYLPYVGKTMRQLAMARFGRAFGALYRAGVPITTALKLSADACGNEFLRARMYPAYKQLEEGRRIGETLRDTNAFSPIVLDMVSTGEQTGNLDHMLNKAADFYSEEASTRSTQMGVAVGVFVLICVAIYIGYIVISFYMNQYGPGIENAIKQT